MNCKYTCLKCGHYFERESPGPVKCPKCGHPYVDWINYRGFPKYGKKEAKDVYNGL